MSIPPIQPTQPPTNTPSPAPSPRAASTIPACHPTIPCAAHPHTERLRRLAVSPLSCYTWRERPPRQANHRAPQRPPRRPAAPTAPTIPVAPSRLARPIEAHTKWKIAR